MKGRPFELHDIGSKSLARDTDIDEVLTGLDGKFSLGAVSAGGLLLATDLIGAGPLYYTAKGDRILYGTHLGLVLWLLDEVPECDRVGAAAILIALGQIGRQTPFREVSRLLAGERLAARVEGGQLRYRVNRYAAVEDLVSTDVPRREEAVHRFGELLEASLAREQHPPGTSLMLSGGRDSRAIALTMPDRQIEAVTYGAPESRDVRGAKLLAARLGLKHWKVPYNSWTYEDFASQIVGLTAGANTLETAHNMVGFSWAASHGATLTVVGFLGGSLTGTQVGSAEQVPEWQRRKKLFRNLDAFDVDIRMAFPEEVDLLLHAVDKQREELSGLSPAQTLMVQDWTIRQACWISTMFDIAEWYVDVSYPFYYRPLLKLMFNRPFSDLREQRLYDEWLASAHLAAGVRAKPSYEPLTSAMLTGWSIIRRRRRPPYRIYWPHVTARSRPWLERVLATGTGPFLDISRRSYEHALENRPNRIPTFLASLPLMLAVDMRQNAGLLMEDS
jgi:hypothetical protein